LPLANGPGGWVTQGSSQKSLVIKIFAVGHLKIVDFPALAKNDKQLPKSQKVLLCYDFSGTLGRFYKKALLFCRNSTLKGVH